MPLYSCMESALTTSPPTACASATPRSDLPVAVGPTTAITRVVGTHRPYEPGPLVGVGHQLGDVGAAEAGRQVVARGRGVQAVRAERDVGQRRRVSVEDRRGEAEARVGSAGLGRGPGGGRRGPGGAGGPRPQMPSRAGARALVPPMVVRPPPTTTV